MHCHRHVWRRESLARLDLPGVEGRDACVVPIAGVACHSCALYQLNLTVLDHHMVWYCAAASAGGE